MTSTQHHCRGHVRRSASHHSTTTHVYPSPTEHLAKARSPPTPGMSKPKSWVDTLNEPGGVMKLKGTFQAIFAMEDVEYPDSAEADWINRRPRRYGKHGERCSTVKYMFKYVGYHARMFKQDISRLWRDA